MMRYIGFEYPLKFTKIFLPPHIAQVEGTFQANFSQVNTFLGSSPSRIDFFPTPTEYPPKLMVKSSSRLALLTG